MNRFKILALTGALTGVLVIGVAPVAAHEPHEAANAKQGEGQVIANGQNHPRFIGTTACENYGPVPGYTIGPSWYGIETAHHGPDSGDPGNDPNEGATGDTRCYQADAPGPGGDPDNNPAIR